MKSNVCIALLHATWAPHIKFQHITSHNGKAGQLKPEPPLLSTKLNKSKYNIVHAAREVLGAAV